MPTGDLSQASAETGQFVSIYDMASRPHRRPVSHLRACHMCGAGFHAIRSDARFCGKRCCKRAERAEDIDPDDVDCEWDKETPFEPDSVTRATASDWQLKQAMRLAEELALLRPGTAPHEISRQTLRRVRRVQRAWAALWKELRARSRTPVNTPASEDGGRQDAVFRVGGCRSTPDRF